MEKIIESSSLESLDSKNAFPRGTRVRGWTGATHPKFQDHCGRFIRLEPLQNNHLESLHAVLLKSPEHDWYYMPFGPFKTLQEFKDWADSNLKKVDPMFFAILGQSSDEVLGFLSYLNIVPNHGSIEIGFIQFATKLQRTTGATEAIWLLIKHAFDLGYRRVEWKCDSLNGRSRRAAKRLGFLFEGIFRQALVVKDRNRDTAWYSIIDSEWEKLSSLFQDWLERIHSSDNYISLTELANCKEVLEP